MTLFKDQNGKAVLIHSSITIKQWVLAELNDAYDDVTGFILRRSSIRNARGADTL